MSLLDFSSILSKTEPVGSSSLLEIIVRDKLHIINNVATTAVDFVKILPADLENIKLSCEIPIPELHPLTFVSIQELLKSQLI